jgi:integrase/recombinase XerD
VVKLEAVRNAIAERTIEHDDVVTMLAMEPDARNKALLRLLYETGARVSEVIGLKWSDIAPRDEGRAQITIFGKGGRTRHVLISATLYEGLTAIRASSEYVFRSRSGRALDRERLPSEPVFRQMFQLIGCATLAPRTLWTVTRLSRLCKRN